MTTPFQIKELLGMLTNVTFYGDENVLISDVIAVSDSIGRDCSNCLSWLSDSFIKSMNSDDYQSLKIGLMVCSKSSFELLKTAKCNFIITEKPRAAFVKIISEKFKKQPIAKTEVTAVIHNTAVVGNACYIGHHVVIEANCVIGNNCSILHNTVLLAGTVIGNNVTIGCNNTIGNYGFGYEKDESGDNQLFEHLGKVIIHDNVEIHNNTCIDRGVLGNTVIYDNVKIDNLVHIAHGVIIGRNSLIIANALIGGSTEIGENSWIAPSATIKNKIKIAANNLIGLGAVVLKNTEPDSTLIGNPAITMEEYKKKKKGE